MTLARKLVDILSEVLEDMAAAKAFTIRVHQARFAGESIVSTEGLW